MFQIGIGIFLGTLIISTLISIFFKPILVNRYLLPSTGVLWLVFAILIGKIENKKKLAILLILILILTIGSVSTNIDDISNHDKEIKDYKLIHKMNNNNSIIIYSGGWALLQFENNLDKANGYTLNNTVKGCEIKSIKSKLITNQELKNIIQENPDKKIYIIQDYYDNNVTLENKVKIGKIWHDKRSVYILK